MSALIDMVGQRYGRLTVLKRAENNSQGKVCWLCRCDCGGYHAVGRNSLVKGYTSSCGCLQREVATAAATKHAMRNTRFYRIWRSMRTRCLNPNTPSYANYGGRGILICDRWASFETFRDDLYEPYLTHAAKNGERNTTIERKDVDGNYEPVNVTWATYAEQAANRRSTINAKGVRQWSNGTWEANIMRNCRSWSKTFPTKEQALAWRKQKLAEIYDVAAE